MGLRLRRTIRICKGIRLNISKSGISTTVGRRGASVTVGKDRSSVNVGIPGTGISYRKEFRPSAEEPAQKRITSYIVEMDRNDSSHFVIRTEGGKIVTDPALIAAIRNSFEMDRMDRDSGHSRKSRSIALVLCILLGWLGVHRFYVGKIGTGILYLFTCGGFMIGLIVDLISILSGRFTDRQNRPLVEWK